MYHDIIEFYSEFCQHGQILKSMLYRGFILNFVNSALCEGCVLSSCIVAGNKKEQLLQLLLLKPTDLQLSMLKNYPFFSDPGGARTLDPMIKSHLLYQLSYGVIPFSVMRLQR